MKKKYFPNDIEAVMDSSFPDDINVGVFMEERAEMWMIPSSVCCVLRCSNTKTGKVSEHTYQRPHAARKKIESLMQDPDNEVLVANDEAIVMISSNDMHDRLKP